MFSSFLFFFVALTDTVDLDGCSLPTTTVKVAVISLIEGEKKRPTKPFDRI